MQQVQHDYNDGKCGPCGDEFNATRPRENENGGRFGRKLIVRNYTQGQIVDLHIELTAVHLGHFEVKLCPLQSRDELETDDCFEQNVLDFTTGLKEYPVDNELITNYYPQVRLPQGFKCERCVMQWHYLSG